MSEPATLGKLRVDLARRRISIEEEERHDEWRIDHVKRASKSYGRSWMVVFDDAADLLSRVKLQPVSVRVLWWGIGHLDPREWRQIDQSELAWFIECDRTSVSRALTELCDRGIFQREGRGYRTSIWLGWRGTAQAYQAERRKRRAEIANVRELLERVAAPAATVDILAPWRRIDVKPRVVSAKASAAGKPPPGYAEALAGDGGPSAAEPASPVNARRRPKAKPEGV